MLSQIIVIAGMCVALWVAARWVKHEAARVDKEMRRAQVSLDRARNDGAQRLQLDPETGRYYPV